MSNENAHRDPPGVQWDYRWVGEALVCTRCGRGWHVGPSKVVNEENFTYLCEHRDQHRRDQADRRRPPQQWRP